VKAVTGGALLLLASAAAIGIASLDVTHGEMRRAYETRVEFVLETTAQGMAPRLFPKLDRDEVELALQSPVRTDGVLFCACFAADGTLAGFCGLPDADEPLAPRLAELGPAGSSSLRMKTRRGDEIKLLATPVSARPVRAPSVALDRAAPNGELAPDVEARLLFPLDALSDELGEDRSVGMLLLGYTCGPVEAEFAPVRRRVLMIVVGVGVVTAMLAWLVARVMVRPIHELVDGTQRIADGDFDHRVQVTTRDELALLAESFNAMTVRLAESRDGLARHQEGLEQKVLERTRRLREAYSELQVLEKMKDGFLSTISHELRTPITSIRAFAEILQSDPSVDSGTRQEFAGIILKESDHLSHLVSDVLDLVTMESGEVPFRFAETDVAELARAAAQELAAQAQQRSIAVEIVPSPGLPTVRCDGGKIIRLFLELLDNAIRFSPEGGRVVVTVSRAGELVRTEVRDEGPGIPERELESVFERFHQCGELLTAKPSGQGLGLAICRVIAVRHGGTIVAVSSRPGAHLVLDLPIRAMVRPAPVTAKPPVRESPAVATIAR
jgi:signal transduction histidine kinase